MTPQEHNKYLGIAHLAYGGIQSIIYFAMSLFVFAILMSEPGEAGAVVALIFAAILSFFWLLFTLPSFIAAYGLLKRKSWARTAGIISAVAAAMNVPHGTAVCIYSLWFFFSDAGREFYGKREDSAKMRQALYGAPAGAWWNTTDAASRSTEERYAPPTQPPDWR